jgi:1-acyl-sn-glycerol-3-phosphate acyltransferase
VKIRTVLAGLLAVLFILLLIPVLFVCFLIQFRAPILAFTRGYFGLVWPILGFKVTITGREYIAPGSQYVFMANHQSYIDGPLLFWAIPGPVRVILKKGVFRLPVIGLCMRFVGFIPVDRKRLRGGIRSLARAAEFMVRRGFSYLIFPEGTRTRDGRFQPFKRGGFFLALKSGASIVPVAIRGTFDLMPRGRLLIGTGPIHVDFFPPVPIKAYGEETMLALIEKVRQTIARGLNPKESPSWTANTTPKN